MRNPGLRRGTRFGFRMIGNPKPRRFDHRDIVCPIPHRERIRHRPFPFVQRGEKRLLFRGRPDDRTADRTVKHPPGNTQPVCDHTIEPYFRTDRFRKAREASRHQDGVAPMRPNRPDKRCCTRHDLHPFGKALFDHCFWQPFQQGDATLERLLEIELAAHRALGHFSDLGLDSGIVGQLVDAFDRDHRRVHVRHNQPSAAFGAFLNDNVHTGKRAFKRASRRNRVTCEVQVARNFRFKPAARHANLAAVDKPVRQCRNIALFEPIRRYKGCREHEIPF